jgi:seryl-tRNA synthetase
LQGVISSFVCSFLQSLADRAQARVGLRREAANAHAEVAAAREATLQAQIEVALEIQRVKETMAHHAQKEVAALKKKLEVTEQKAKDATTDLQAVMEGNLPTSPQVDSAYFASSCC